MLGFKRKSTFFHVKKLTFRGIQKRSFFSPLRVRLEPQNGLIRCQKRGGKVSLFGSYQTPKIFTNFFLVLTGHFLYIYISSGVSPTLAAGPPRRTTQKFARDMKDVKPSTRDCVLSVVNHSVSACLTWWKSSARVCERSECTVAVERTRETTLAERTSHVHAQRAHD